MKAVRASLSVTSDDPHIVTRAVEAMCRAGSGLALERIAVLIMVGPDDDEVDQ